MGGCPVSPQTAKPGLLRGIVPTDNAIGCHWATDRNAQMTELRRPRRIKAMLNTSSNNPTAEASKVRTINERSRHIALKDLRVSALFNM